MKQSKTAIKELTARYRAVLLKCALINAMMFIGIGAANAASLIVSEDEDITVSGQEVYDKIEVNGGTLSFNNGKFMTAQTSQAREDISSITNGTMALSAALLDMNSAKLTIDNSELTIGTGSQITSREIEVTNNSRLNLNTVNSGELFSRIAFEADSFSVSDSTVSMSGGGYGISSGSNGINITNSEITSHATSIAYTKEEDGHVFKNSALKLNGSSIFNVNGDVKVEAVSVSEASAVFSQGEIILSDSTINLNGRLNANINATDGSIIFQTSAARINGELSGTGVDLTFNDNYLFSDINNKATLNTVKIAEGKTLNIGTGTLTATNFTGGTISAVLTDAAKNSAIITGNATDVTLALDMSNASRDEVTLYKITDGTGFTFANYAANRYAVSGTSFDIADASSLSALSGWNGGDLYILRLATAGEAAVEDLQKAGILVSLAEQNAIKVLDLAQSVLSKLDAAKQAAIAKVNDLLDQAAGKAQETKQILREIAPDTSSSGTKTALNTAKSVINVIGARLGGNTSGNMRGRSGGDYSVGQSSVWAQGMYNYAKLDTADGFKSDSTGFAAGIETNLTDSFKAGIGYAFTKTDIDTDRSQTDVDTHTGFVYGEYKPNKFYVNAIASYGHSEYDDTTNLIGLTSDYSADTISSQIAAGYDFGLLTPEAALRYTHIKQDDHTDALGATIQSKSFDTWTAVGGVKLSKKYTLESNRRVGITPELKLAATYDFERDDETNTVVLADGSSYIVDGDMMKRFGVEAGANVGVTIGNDSEITLSYEGKFKKDYQDHTGLINFKYNF